MRRVLGMLRSDLRFAARGESAPGALPHDDRDGWLARIQRLLRDVDTPALAQMLADDDLSPSGLRHDRSALERLVADRLARGGWRLATGVDQERGYVLPGGTIEEEEGELEGDEGETLTVSFFVDAEPRFVDADIEGELDPEHFEAEIEGELDPEHFEVELEGELVPAPIRGWLLGGELEELEEEAEAVTLRAAAVHGTPFCEECARLAAAQAAGDA